MQCSNGIIMGVVVALGLRGGWYVLSRKIASVYEVVPDMFVPIQNRISAVFCSECGQGNSESAKFCTRCGQKIPTD
jgi:Na+/pantothenate symporter